MGHKICLKTNCCHNAVASAVYQCLKCIPKTDYENAFQKWLKRLKLCVSHNWEYFEGKKKK